MPKQNLYVCVCACVRACMCVCVDYASLTHGGYEFKSIKTGFFSCLFATQVQTNITTDI